MSSANITHGGEGSSYFKINSQDFYKSKAGLEHLANQLNRLEGLVGEEHVRFAVEKHTEVVESLEKAELILVDVTPSSSDCSNTLSMATIKGKPEDAEVYRNDFLVSNGIEKIVRDMIQKLRIRNDFGATIMLKIIQLSNSSDVQEIVKIIKEKVRGDAEFMVDFEAKTKNVVAEYFAFQVQRDITRVAEQLAGLSEVV